MVWIVFNQRVDASGDGVWSIHHANKFFCKLFDWVWEQAVGEGLRSGDFRVAQIEVNLYAAPFEALV